MFLRITRHFDDRCTKLSSENREISTSAVWENRVDQRYIYVRSSQYRMRLFDGACRTYTILRLQHCLEDIQSKLIILDNQDVETVGHLCSPSESWPISESLGLWRSASMRSILGAAFVAATIAASTLGSVPDDSITSSHEPP